MLLKVIAEIDSWVERVERGLVWLLLPALVVVTFLQVIFRYVLGAPLIWSEELAIYVFIWIAFVGSSMAIPVDGHYGIDILQKRLPPKLRTLAVVLTHVVSVGFLAAVTGLGAEMMAQAGHVSAATQVSMRWFYAAIPVGGFFMFVRLGARLCREWTGAPADT